MIATSFQELCQQFWAGVVESKSLNERPKAIGFVLPDFPAATISEPLLVTLFLLVDWSQGLATGFPFENAPIHLMHKAPLAHFS